MIIKQGGSMKVLTRITRPAGQVRAHGIRGQDCALFDDHEIFDGDEFALSNRIKQPKSHQ
jgi:hypothetical protein